ncbi:TPA: hypothetical protein ACF6TA_004560, partial [Salmonella enterica subsp. enterica serovar Infantis]
MGRPRAALEDVRRIFTDRGHTPTFTDADYVNSQSRLSYVCGSCGSVGGTSAMSMQRYGSTKCKNCKQRVSVEEARARFYAAGHTPTFSDTDYSGVATPLSFICGTCRVESEMPASRVTDNKGQCGHCVNTVGSVPEGKKIMRKGSFKEAKAEAKAKNLRPLFAKTDYAGSAKITLRVACTSCGHEFKTSLSRMRCMTGSGCAKCNITNSRSKKLVTRHGEFTYSEASARYGIKRGTIAARAARGWSGDEVCGITQRAVAGFDPERAAFVYGWWSPKRARYVYIGVTVVSVKHRVSQHISDATSKEGAAFQRLLRAEGADSFEVHTLWTGVLADAQDAERRLIKKHRTCISKGGFNTVVGGSLGSA